LNAPRVTIITPTYNHEKFISQCIKSVLDQSFQDWELFIIDGGSTDLTIQKASEFKDKRITILAPGRIGIYQLKRAYNIGLSQSRGQLVTHLEGDDYWPQDRLLQQVHAFEDRSVVLCYGLLETVNSDGITIRKASSAMLPVSYKVRSNDPPGEALTELLYRNFIPWPTVMIAKDALLRVGGYQQPFYFPAVDYPTLLSLSLLGKFRFVDRVFAYYRRHPQQATVVLSDHSTGSERISLEFLSKLKLSNSKALSLLGDISESRIKIAWRRQQEWYKFVRGLRLLVSQNWTDSSKIFNELIRSKYLGMRLQVLAALGRLLSEIRLSPTPAFELLRRLGYSEVLEIYVTPQKKKGKQIA
jgi:glycosyltransferase involved in cell wall biosynthesis